MLVLSEVEQLGQRSSIWKSCIWVSKLVEIGVEKSTKGSGSGLRVVLEKIGYEVNSFSGSSVAEHFFPW